MLKQKRIGRVLVIILFIISNHSGKAQRLYDSTTINIFEQFENLQAAYATADHISFNATYYLTDNDSTVTRDTSYASFQINGNNSHIIIDSIESIQNDKYFATIYYENTSVVVQKPQALANQLLQVNINDPVFQQMGMSAMSLYDSINYRKINILFDADALYKDYTLVFDTLNYHLLYINYTLRKNADISNPNGPLLPGTGGNPAINEVSMFISFNNYQSGSFTDSVFLTDPFFIVEDNQNIIPGVRLNTDFEFISLLE